MYETDSKPGHGHGHPCESPRSLALAGLTPPSLGSNLLQSAKRRLLIIQVEKLRPRPGCVHLCMSLTKPYRKVSCKTTLRMTGQGVMDSQGRPRACWFLRLGREKMTGMKVAMTQPHTSCQLGVNPCNTLPCFPGHKWQPPVPRKLEAYWGQIGVLSHRVQCSLPGCMGLTILDPEWAPRVLCSSSSSDS